MDDLRRSSTRPAASTFTTPSNRAGPNLGAKPAESIVEVLVERPNLGAKLSALGRRRLAGLQVPRSSLESIGLGHYNEFRGIMEQMKVNIKPKSSLQYRSEIAVDKEK
ncbi:hypothetical protein KIN20_021317 [Parelaphostrongylus tenuis]|uniref:Uncharacterized protein n=1 Tax=Parelaphostrongylus tenuis TaxID=148309 RepID=A0AAD5QU35_PARTN|nr:hypothetical protein KIN20_021317 [Parelaphostrongylus tenuis]